MDSLLKPEGDRSVNNVQLMNQNTAAWCHTSMSPPPFPPVFPVALSLLAACLGCMKVAESQSAELELISVCVCLCVLVVKPLQQTADWLRNRFHTKPASAPCRKGNDLRLLQVDASSLGLEEQICSELRVCSSWSYAQWGAASSCRRFCRSAALIEV